MCGGDAHRGGTNPAQDTHPLGGGVLQLIAQTGDLKPRRLGETSVSGFNPLLPVLPDEAGNAGSVGPTVPFRGILPQPGPGQRAAVPGDSWSTWP